VETPLSFPDRKPRGRGEKWLGPCWGGRKPWGSFGITASGPFQRGAAFGFRLRGGRGRRGGGKYVVPPTFSATREGKRSIAEGPGKPSSVAFWHRKGGKSAYQCLLRPATRWAPLGRGGGFPLFNFKSLEKMGTHTFAPLEILPWAKR